MNRKILPLIAAAFFAGSMYAQTVTIQSGSSLFLGAGSVLSVDGLVLEPSADFTVTGPNAITTATTVNHPAANLYISRVYRLAHPVSSYSGAITIYYQDAELNSLAESSLTLNAHNGTLWRAYPTGAIRNASDNFVTTSGLSSISWEELTLASQSNPLPLQWLGIRAFAQGQNNIIVWKTTDEVDVKDFQLQKSSNGTHWVNEGNPIAANNTPGVHQYACTDAARYTPRSFYRVRQTDLDGRSSYSPVVSVKAGHANALVLMPNPAVQQVSINAAGSSINAVTVYNAAGKSVYAISNISQPMVTIPVSGWPAGYYYALLSINGKMVAAGFIKN